MQGDQLVADLYTRMAHVYEERVAPRFAPLATHTVHLARLRPGDRALDVGCGTGLATLLAAPLVGPQGSVMGVDFSEGQLGIAVAKAQMRGAANVRFERVDATKLGFQGAFDAAFSNLGIPADFAPTFAGMQRALKPGGRLSVTEWAVPRSDPFEGFQQLLGKRLVQDAPPDLREARALIAERRAQFDVIGTAEGLRGALAAAGFVQIEVAPVRYVTRFASARDAYDFVLSWGWQEQEVRMLPGPEREQLKEAMAQRFGAAPFDAEWHLLHATAQAP